MSLGDVSNPTNTELGDGASSSEDQLNNHLDILTDKKKKSVNATKAALKGFNNELMTNFCGEFVAKNRTSILESIKRHLKSGTAEEKSLAARTLVLVTISLGNENEDIYDNFYDTLITNIKYHENISTRCESIGALAGCCFVGIHDYEKALNCTEFLQSLIEEEQPSEVQKSLLEAYGLLLTRIQGQDIIDRILPNAIYRIVALISSNDTNPQLYAGEVLALIIEQYREEDEEFDLTYLDEYIDHSQLLDTLEELTKENDRHRAKKDRSLIRSRFKVVLDSVEQNVVPTESAKFQHQQVAFKGWIHYKQLQFFREYLHIGFYDHFLNNPVVQEIFDIKLRADFSAPHLTGVEKRLTRSSNSAEAKARTQFLSNRRKNRSDRLNDTD
eukprot:TRINITY_DN15164_c0_g1_i1.p1 TRINITY_DN15164_c0_g1~~TRINITY_DN15164_c0_g1_i1.p1  ORF type:complete len:386 (-),score=56.44 TRINITY_DN15164_c0_g1_i1:194-1351(-)